VTNEQRALLEKARDSLRAAVLLADEEFYDIAVSRAYYAMFYTAEAFLLSDGSAFSKHSAVIAAFGQKYIKTGLVSPKFHRYLIDSQDRRNVADYEVKTRTSKRQATIEIRHAEEFLELAAGLIGPIDN
jgi:uncharacterized protein (UPF0332 family)